MISTFWFKIHRNNLQPTAHLYANFFSGAGAAKAGNINSFCNRASNRAREFYFLFAIAWQSSLPSRGVPAFPSGAPAG